MKILYDVEVFPNYFCVALKEYQKEKRKFFEISQRKNDILEIINFFKNFNGFLISFNGIHYDNIIIKHLLINEHKFKYWSYLEICNDLKRLNDCIIDDTFTDEIKKLKYYKQSWKDIDLYLYWSKMTRISKKISLKSLGIQLGYPVVQELPFKPNTYLKIDDLEKLKEYNEIHDLGILELLLKDKEEEVILRNQINKQYNLDCWSWDAPKIASESLLQSYCQKKNLDPNIIRKQRFEKNVIYFNNILKGFEPDFQLPIFKNFWVEVLNSKNSFNKELVVIENNTSLRISYGVGGIHSINENESYFSNEEEYVVTSDIESMYPNLIINFKCIRFLEVLERYIEVKEERILAKQTKDKLKDTFLKLILNSVSGLLDMEHSWLYFPEGALRMRIIGQLFLTKAIEECILNNWKVISANTKSVGVLKLG